jgi:dCMP deaminase
VLHAEANAILKIARSANDAKGSTLYITLSPCKECCKLILQAGIKRMVYINEYKDTTGLDFLRSAELEIVQIPDIG